MAVEVIMPQLGLTMTEGKIIHWLKREGDKVKQNEAIVEILTDKATYELEAPESGYMLKILASEGSVVPISKIIAYIGQQNEELPDDIEESGANLKQHQSQQSSVKPSKIVHKDKETDRVKISPRAKRVANEMGLTDNDFLYIEGTGPNSRIIENDVLSYAKSKNIKITPLASKISKEYQISPNQIKGTGISGKITRKDVFNHEEYVGAYNNKNDYVNGKHQKANNILVLKGIRKITAEKMAISSSVAPHVTLMTEADITDTLSYISRLNEKEVEPKVSITAYLIKVCAMCLYKNRSINSSLSDDESIILHENANVGMAVATDEGLIVPVIKLANEKSISQITLESKRLVHKAKEGKLVLDEMSGGTFTITNLGMYGVDYFTPIINLPECAILGIGRIMNKPFVKNNDVVVRSIIYLSLSFDHRVVDGVPAVKFLDCIKQNIEFPFQLLVEV